MLLSYGLQAHTNVHILYYPLKTGEGVLQSIVFFSFYNIYTSGQNEFLERARDR